ncbi:MAG: phosphoribosylamine--glycine ligase [Oscillospiraceae bacterium]|nr:phosphoribosylamine--glycine ligase [Oscillospiraceae bacterium]
MKILIVGSGSREHALARAIMASPLCSALYCAPGNGGLAADGVTCVPIKASDVGALSDFATAAAFDLVVVAPDDPLVMGLVDALEARGIPAFGPTKKAAAIEGSKVFAKGLMGRLGIPTAQYKSFWEPSAALHHIRSLNEWPIVIKADGLALGKGVVIAQNMDEAESAIRLMMEDKVFGKSGDGVVVEEFLSGPEVSVLAFCDGTHLVPMISAMDHKRAYDGNQGPNTGGMGVVAPNPHYTPEMAERCMREIFLPTLRGMAAEGIPFKGCLYFGLMLTAHGPVVIEYNCRFGDPETQAVLPLLESDLVEIMLACREGRLVEMDIRWKDGCAACLVLSSGGYPGPYPIGLPIRGLDKTGQLPGSDLTVYHAGSKREYETDFVTAGGRVLGLSGTGGDLHDALEKVYTGAGQISFDGMHYRRDIGKDG